MTLFYYRGVRGPEPDNVVIWRYMEWWKFEALLRDGGLFFARADRQADPWEGYPVESTYERVMIQALDGASPEAILERAGTTAKQVLSLLKEMQERQRCFALLSCWHVHPTESLRMWEAYANAPDSVAIQTTVGDLKQCLDESPDGPLYLGFVRYESRDEAYLPIDGMLLPYFRKDPEYAFEQELRALRWNSPDNNLNKVSWDAYDQAYPEGSLVRVDLRKLIRSVRVLPNAPQSFANKIKAVLDSHGLDDVDVAVSALPFGPPSDVRKALEQEGGKSALRRMAGDRGLLQLHEYEITVDDRFRESVELHELDDGEAKSLLLRAAMIEQLTPALRDEGHLSNYFLGLARAPFSNLAGQSSVLLLGLRLGAEVRMQDGWRLYHDEFPPETILSPVEALRAFANKFGYDFRIKGDDNPYRLVTNHRIQAINMESIKRDGLFASWRRPPPGKADLKGVFHFQQHEGASEATLAIGMLFDTKSYKESLGRSARRESGDGSARR